MQSVSDGDITPSEAEAVAKLIEVQARIREASEFERRLQSIEEKISASRPA
jgi:hypothetical protein